MKSDPGVSTPLERERQLVIDQGNDTRTDYPRDACVHEIFEAHALRTPDAIAASFEARELTYRQLNRAANRLARRLLASGASLDDPVGILGEASLDTIVGLLAILKAGGAYMPLDPRSPEPRLRALLKDVGARIVVAPSAMSERIRFDGRVVSIDADADPPEGGDEDDRNPTSGASATSAAYVLFTSGSTGRPNGVAVLHRGVVRLVVGTNYVDVVPSDRVLHVSNLSFDASTFEIWGALLNGARLVIMKRETMLSPSAFASAVAREQITGMLLPTALFHQIAAAAPQAFRGLRFVLFGGESCDPKWARRVLEMGPPERLVNAYGPTENAVIATCHLVRDVPPGGASVPIGRPISNTQVYILNDRLEPTPAGEPGELYLGGDGVARGYLNRPDLTAERFLPSPFAGEPGERLYKTGDRARYLEDGSIEFLGRIDAQVKLRGFRVEPGEIEAALGEHPGVRHAVVIAREEISGDKRLVAYLEPARDPAPGAGELREFLRRKLPEYMVPSAFVAVESLPLTPNGKVDRRALPAPDASRPDIAEPFAAPRSETEEALAKVWSDVLSVERAGIHDDFFSLGGHSLRAIQITSRIRDRFNVEISLQSFLARPTIAGLAALVQQARAEGEGADPVIAEPRATVAAMSFAQERLWFFYLLAPQSSVYNCPAFFVLRGLLDAAALERSLQELVARHESLRTRFVEMNGQVMQVIGAASARSLPIIDLSELPAKEREAWVQRRVDEEARSPFDLREGPLLRASLLRLRWNEHVLLLNLHHSITDAWSREIFHKELGTLYNAFKGGAPSPLEALPLQYADFAASQRRRLETGRLDADLAWWKDRLAGAPLVLDLPTDRPRPPVQTFQGATVSFTIGRDVHDALRALGAQEGATPSMVLFAAFSALLYRYTGQEDILVGTLHASRGRVEAERIIGFFVNTLVLRCNLSDDPSFRDLVARTRDMSAEAYDRSAVPFERVVSALSPERDLSRNPVIQVLFAPQPAEVSRLELAGLNVRALESDPGKSAFDLTLFFWEGPAGFEITLEYSTALFDRETITRLGDHLRTLLEGGARQPSLSVSTLPLLSEAERQELLFTWNDTRTEYPRDACVHELFEAQAARTPDAVAASFDGVELRYSTLNRRANRLARRLRASGVGPGVHVGIYGERSLDALVGLLAILKAGGAYVPLDPEYPAERLKLMLEDTGAPVLIAKHAWAERLPFGGLTIDYTDVDSADESDEDLRNVTRAHDIAYVMFTSGSSGRPKGASVPHRGIVRLVLNTNYVEITPSDRLIHGSSLSFDTSTFEIWGALLHGARLIVMAKETLLSPKVFADQVRREAITVMFLSTALFHQLAAAIPRTFLGLRYLIMAGEALDPKWTREVLEKGPPLRLVNAYGPTENSTFSTAYTARDVPAGAASIPIGTPISNSLAYVLDSRMQPVPIGVVGELYVGGDGVARGYVSRPNLTAERFLANPFVDEPGALLYKTGDRSRYLRDGSIEFLGRLDDQVKVRGFRIEPAEIEATLMEHPEVRTALVMAREDAPGDKRLVAYLVPEGGSAPGVAALREFLQRRLPDYMVPAFFITLPALPLTPNGKVDRRALPAPGVMASEPSQSFVAPRGAVEETLCAIWCDVLGLPKVGIDDPFFERGGDSLRMTRVQREIHERLGLDVGIVALFQHPTIRQLTEHLRGDPKAALPHATPASERRAPSITTQADPKKPLTGTIAIIGMAGRFPGAKSVEALWELLKEGKEGIRPFVPNEIEMAGAEAELAYLPGFVPRCGFIDDAASFDAAFFGYSPLDARLMDPQQRVFLECAWAALEDAGYDPARFRGPIGIFGGSGVPRYWLERVASRRLRPGTSAEQRGTTGNPWQFLATQTSYKLGLRGPAVTIQTACSTSLVAVHLACESLLARESDLALAGGVSMFSLGAAGYLFEQGGILSPDGLCRPFDAKAQGTVPASGVGLVVLKRLSDALESGDTIHAIIRGSAINNDGSKKVSYSAPSVDGQREVLLEAYAAAGVSPETITFVEAHGTATPIGDPIEVAALTAAFRSGGSQRGYCALGSVKSNIGHLDSAAGIAGLIKATLAVERGLIPPTLHFERPNPAIKLDESPFFVNDALMPWQPSEGPRRAGVSSFGIGGTNAHVVLEQAPQMPPSGPSRSRQLLVLSARTRPALASSRDALIKHMQRSPETPLADVAFTLQQGRASFEYRHAVVGATFAEAAEALSVGDPSRCATGVAKGREPKLVFMFPGIGIQQPNMGHELYQHERAYRDAFDDCADRFATKLGFDIRSLVFPDEAGFAESMRLLERPSLNMASIFSTEYALLQLLLSWGLRPAATTGHSLGEYVAACLSGMLLLEDAVALVALRGQLLDAIPDAAMLIVPLSEAALSGRTAGSALAIAAVNGPESCVVSGPLGAVESLRVALTRDGIEARRLPVATASHSTLMDPVAGRLTERAASMNLKPPRIPVVSNVTGGFITEADACDPAYWGRHLRSTIRFADGLALLLADPSHALVEVGPGKTLATLARMHPKNTRDRLIATTMTHHGSNRTDLETLLFSIGRLWCAGVTVDWGAFTKEEQRRRVPLPTYSFQKKNYLLELTAVQEYESLSIPPSMPNPSLPNPSLRGDHEALSLPRPARMPALPAAQDLPPGATKDAYPSAVGARSSAAASAIDGVEATLSNIWRVLLGVDTIRATDNFFDCGGNSLIAVHLRASVHTHLQVPLPMHVLIEHPTFGELLAAVRKAGAVAPVSAPVSAVLRGSRSSDRIAATSSPTLPPGPSKPTLPPGDAKPTLPPEGAAPTPRPGDTQSTLRPEGTSRPTPPDAPITLQAVALPPDDLDNESGPMTLRSNALQRAIHAAVPAITRRSLSVRLHEGSHGKSPLFFLPPVGGTVFTYVELARHLHGERPVYAFRTSGLEPGEPIYQEISVMAAVYLEEMLAIQPEGPYVLGGHSGGGTIAYEMACQLAERRQEPILVWMADTGFTTQYQRMNVTGIEQVLDNLSAFKDIAPRAFQAFSIALAESPSLGEIVVSNYKALSSYQPKPTAAEIIYIRAREREAVLDKHPEAGWMDLTQGPFVVHNAPGNHFTMIEAPCAAPLARVIQQHADLFFAEAKPGRSAR